jgi:hypothetical protein
MFKQGIHKRVLCLVVAFVFCAVQIDACYAQTLPREGFVCTATLQSRIDDQRASNAFVEKLSVKDKVWKTTDPRNEHAVDKFTYCVKTHDMERLLQQENAPRYYSLSVIDETHLKTFMDRDIALLLDFPDEYVELVLRQMPDNAQAFNKSRGSLMRFIHDNLRLNHTNVLFWKKGRYVWPSWNKNLVFFILNMFNKLLRKIDKSLMRIECAFISDLDERIEYEQTRIPSFFIKIDTAIYAFIWTTLLMTELFFDRFTRGIKMQLIDPTAVIRERNKNSKEVSIFNNNEIVVKNGPELTIKGVGLVVRSEHNSNFPFTLRVLKSYGDLIDHLAEHQLPIVLLPEKGTTHLDESRQILLDTIKGIHEIRPYTFLLQPTENKTPETYSGKWDDFQHLHSA